MEEFAPWSTETLDAWFRAWTHGFVHFSAIAGLLALSILVIVGASATSRMRRRFWCRPAGREVETEFETRGLWHRATSVLCCSAFETPTAIACRRTCLDATHRGRRGPALPFLDPAALVARPEPVRSEP